MSGAAAGAASASEVRPPLALPVLIGAAALKLALHLGTNLVTPYGYHRDELLYLAMGHHLRLWRMDFPPGIALLARLTRATLGDGLFAIRFLPAVFGTLVLVLAVQLARELGGGRAAQGLAALAVLANPLFLRSASLFQPVVLDQAAWTLGLFALLRLCRRPTPRWWLGLGVAMGLGLLCKFSIAFIGLGILAGIMVTPLRGQLRTPWPWLAFLVSLLIGSPSLVGQLALHFPVAAQMDALRHSQLERVGPAQFIGHQFLYGPATILAVVGLAALLAGRRIARYRAAGVATLTAFVLLLALHGKAYYFGPAHPLLIAAGATVLERVPGRRAGPVLRWGTAAALVLFGAGLAIPIGLPLLPPRAMAAYGARLGTSPLLVTNMGVRLQLPQDFADMLGWEEQVRAVARVYDSLPSAERAQAVVFGSNYGEAGALDLFGPRYGLPRPVSDAGSFWFFGPGELPGAVLVKIGGEAADLRPFFDHVTAAARVENPLGVPEERDLTVFVATGARRTLQDLWPALAGAN